jgi:hypothetical protein
MRTTINVDGGLLVEAKRRAAERGTGGAARGGVEQRAGTARRGAEPAVRGVEVCEAGDPKGLFARARRGEIVSFTNVSDPYEAPASHDLRVAGTGRSRSRSSGSSRRSTRPRRVRCQARSVGEPAGADDVVAQQRRGKAARKRSGLRDRAHPGNDAQARERRHQPRPTTKAQPLAG